MGQIGTVSETPSTAQAQGHTHLDKFEESTLPALDQKLTKNYPHDFTKALNFYGFRND
jgi:hypothetical protein